MSAMPESETTFEGPSAEAIPAQVDESPREAITRLEFFATCPFGFEDVLASELRSMRMRSVRPLKGGVGFRGLMKDAYRACLWLRSASRVLLVLDRVAAADAEELYASVKAIGWERYVGEEATIAVFARGTSGSLRDTRFTGMKVKDAVCDRLRNLRGSRPDVAPHDPDVAIWVNLHGKRATVSIDLSGGSLHRRGYREGENQVAAPLKEALAAGILLKAGWDHTFERVRTFHDPMCGGGTFVVEAALIATDRAPGLLRAKWGFQGLLDYDAETFDALLDEADERFEAGLQRELPLFVGCDIDPRAIETAREAARKAGLGELLRFEVADCQDMPKTLEALGAELDQPGFIAVNPPYGVRLMPGQLEQMNQRLRRGLSAMPAGWRLVSITPDGTFDAAIGMDAFSVDAVYNGRIEASVRQYELGESVTKELVVTSLEGVDVPVLVNSEHAEQFAARLRKVAKQRRKWARKEGIWAYRIYDADLPDYAVAVDMVHGIPVPTEPDAKVLDSRRGGGKGRFAKDGRDGKGGRGTDGRVGKDGRDGKPLRPFIHVKRVTADEVLAAAQPYLVVSEYQAPKEIDPNKAARRFADCVEIAMAVLGIPRENVATRVRKQDKGGGQYARAARRSKPLLTVEQGHVFELDLTGYLDTGLFLDHRPVRAMVEGRSKACDFLNLFAYTGSVSVYAAAGGAKSTTTVDLSATYLDWARRNMQRNGFGGREHRFSKADVLAWLDRAAEEGRSYDLVFIDPPTFSNSKAMGGRTWDIQRDHANVLKKVARLLAPEGTILFSGNLRSFRLDREALAAAGLTARDITAATIPEDFKRNAKIHFCFEITRI